MPKSPNSKDLSSAENQANLTKNKSINANTFNDDESFDFFELLFTLWRKKLFIITVTLAVSLSSYFYVKQIPNNYIVEAVLFPPKFNDVIPQFNDILSVNFETNQNPKKIFYDIYKLYRRNLSSHKLQKKFLLETNLVEKFVPKSKNDERAKIDASIAFSSTMMIDYSDYEEKISIRMQTLDPYFTAEVLNKFILFIEKETIDSQREKAQKILDNQIVEVEINISSKRMVAKRRRDDQINRFEEAIIIAKSLGFERRVDATNIIQNTSQIEINTLSTPLYYIGTKALSSEISILKKRKSDDPFILGLRDLQERLALLKSINFNTIIQNAITIDQFAYPTLTPISPNRKLYFTISSFIGLFLAIFIVIIFSAYQKESLKFKKIKE